MAANVRHPSSLKGHRPGFNLRGTKILVAPSSFAEVDPTPMRRLIENGCEVVTNPFKRKLSQEELLRLLANGVEGLIAGLEPLDRTVLERSNLKVISRCGSGLSNVDLEAARDLKIAVFSTPDAPTTAVAELTVGALLSLLRAIPAKDRALRRGEWSKGVGQQIAGKVAAVIGFGRIGQRVGQLLTAFGAEVIAVDPALAGEVNRVPIVTFEEALKRADIITFHCSGDSCLIGESEFLQMKPGVYLLNAARGKVVDEEALIQALESKRVAGAWLDTFSEEPYRGPLLRYEQVILTPHIGSYTLECRKEMEIEAVENLLRGLRQLEKVSA